MITVLRPTGMGRVQLRQYCNHVAKLAELEREAIQVRPLSDWDVRSEWDRINITPGRMVVWLTPNFLPHQNFFRELDYLRGEDVKVVTLREYDALYQPMAEVPTLEPSGICDFPVVFQLAGQHKFTLPPYSRLLKGHSYWLQKATRPQVVTLDQYWMGDGKCPILRSSLGDMLPNCWSGRIEVFGRVIAGGQRTFQKSDILEYWNRRMEAREAWLSHAQQSTATTIRATKRRYRPARG